jgi:hypothetical protein
MGSRAVIFFAGVATVVVAMGIGFAGALMFTAGSPVQKEEADAFAKRRMGDLSQPEVTADKSTRSVAVAPVPAQQSAPEPAPTSQDATPATMPPPASSGSAPDDSERKAGNDVMRRKAEGAKEREQKRAAEKKEEKRKEHAQRKKREQIAERKRQQIEDGDRNDRFSFSQEERRVPRRGGGPFNFFDED